VEKNQGRFTTQFEDIGAGKEYLADTRSEITSNEKTNWHNYISGSYPILPEDARVVIT
jgi:hypothetical protein